MTGNWPEIASEESDPTFGATPEDDSKNGLEVASLPEGKRNGWAWRQKQPRSDYSPRELLYKLDDQIAVNRGFTIDPIWPSKLYRDLLAPLVDEPLYEVDPVALANDLNRCDLCGDPLVEHERPRGICVLCRRGDTRTTSGDTQSCYKCKQIKDLGEFCKNKKSPSGFRGICRQCKCIENWRYRKIAREKRTPEWYLEHKVGRRGRTPAGSPEELVARG